MSPLYYAWLIPLLPAASFAITMVFGRRLGERNAAVMSVMFMLVATLLAAGALSQTSSAAPSWKHHKDLLHHASHAAEELEQLERRLIKAEAVGVSSERLHELEHLVEEAQHHFDAAASEAQKRPAAANYPFTAEAPWLSIRGQEAIPIGMYLDGFAALMLFMVALVCTLIHLFSVEYMKGEERYPLFFAYISLFSAAMLAMVLSRNLFHILLFWEVMGVMSYLLIGFFYKKVSAQQAMKKAFMVTKLADIGLLIGIFWIYQRFGTLDLPRIQELAPSVLYGASATATAIGLLLFVGAIGKSAQFPLHIWLLDAMEGPTPVSAMIHAATMVAAGVYLVARAYPIMLEGDALYWVAAVGVITALFAAVLGTAFADIKKILAWSTVSQLGFMFIALGAFGWVAAVFHLIAHAFFKALLFLCSGSMIHGSGTQDIFEMDELARHMPTTRWTFIIGGVSLAGVIPFAGFWSKDEILLAVQTAAMDRPLYWIVLFMAYAASLLTAFYITRAYIIAFEQAHSASPWKKAPWNQGALGELNMSAAEVEADGALEHPHPHSPPHEAGWRMSSALWILAISATIFGLAGSPFMNHRVQDLVYEGLVPHLEPLGKQIPGFILGTLIAFSGIALAIVMYMTDLVHIAAPQWLTRLLQKRFYLDHLSYTLVANPLTKLSRPSAWFDRRVLDGLIDFLAWMAKVSAEVLRRLQTGRLDHYIWTLLAASLIVIVASALGGA